MTSGPSLKRRAAATLSGVVAAFVIFASCGDDPTIPADAPPNHFVVVEGVAHASGLQDPATHCASCHGEDLRGGQSGEPSCFSCHGQKWR